VFWLTGALVGLAAIASFVSSTAAIGGARPAAGEQTAPCNSGKASGFELVSTIAFSSTRDHTTDGLSPQAGAEIYLINPDGTNPRRLTRNLFADGFPNLSPDGKTIVFDSDRLSGQTNVSDLFVMNADGSEQTFLTRGSSATWSPDCKNIAFHASASGTGTPIRTDPGSATTDSDIFVANVDDLLAGTRQPVNITNTPVQSACGQIEDDADWSPPTATAPNGRIAFTSHSSCDLDQTHTNDAEIYVINPDGTDRLQLTGNNPDPRFNNIEERSPAWSPDGTRIVFSCRIGAVALPNAPFQICLMNADGSDEQQLTNDPAQMGQDLTPSWSPDGQRIVFHRNVPAKGFQLWTMNPDGTGQSQITSTPGISLLAHWGVLRVKG
jgi:dipeptidyl aminopeptidase/acylaminoacyl peptidase